MPRCLLSFAVSDERQMRPPHDLARIRSRPDKALLASSRTRREEAGVGFMAYSVNLPSRI
jgi:hypothetical protein